MRVNKYWIFVILVLGLFLIAGCAGYPGEVAGKKITSPKVTLKASPKVTQPAAKAAVTTTVPSVYYVTTTTTVYNIYNLTDIDYDMVRKGDFNGDGCVDVNRTSSGILTGKDGDMFTFYYQNNDYRADLDENGKVELKDLILLLNYSQKYACKPSSPSLIMPSPCSGVSDGVCPSGCAAGSDNDCCVKAGMTWVNNLCIPRVAYVAKGDFNGNGKVDFNAYVDFAKRFKTTFGGGANSI